MKSLAEGVSFEDPEQYGEALEILKESYFADESKSADEEDVDEDLSDTLNEDANQLHGNMKHYASAISRTTVK